MDDADYSKQFQTEHEARSLRAQLEKPDHGPGETQLIINDEVCCVDCHDPIPAQRLAIKPNAVRCVECKELWERRR